MSSIQPGDASRYDPPSSDDWTFDPFVPQIDPASLGIGVPKYDEQASFAVETQGQAAIDALDDAAKRNTTGPAARLQAAIRGLRNDALREIRANEAKARCLPLDSPARRALEDEIDARAARFRNEVGIATVETGKEIDAGADKSALERFKASLPDYLKEALRREGIWIPGVPGSFMPRTDEGLLGGPTGVDYKVNW